MPAAHKLEKERESHTNENERNEFELLGHTIEINLNSELHELRFRTQ